MSKLEFRIILCFMLVFVVSLVAAVNVQVERPKPDDIEAKWIKYLANKHNLDDKYKLPDGRMPDLVDHENKIAWEVEWCSKWKESYGQAAGYVSSMEGYEPGVWLLYKTGDDEKWNQAVATFRYYRGYLVPYHLKTEVVAKGQ